MALKLLAVGDLHLGRRPGGLPESLREGRFARELGPATALERLVDHAIAEGVHAVALAGDLVEDEHDFFEAYGDLQRAVTRLVEAGIRVLGVAGNHDVQVLPRLADELPDFHLLGRGGQWEQTALTGSDGTEVVLHGWSFPRARVTFSPLEGRRFERDRRPHLGLLHCDRDQHGSHHAPVTSDELHAAGLDAWLLGHIHKPDSLAPQSPSGYLGSVTALRRTEVGPRGPWLYRIGAAGIEAIAQWLLAPLRWEELEVDLSGLEEAGEAHNRLLQAIRYRAREVAGEAMGLKQLGLRVRFTGYTNLRHELEALLRDDETLQRIPGPEGMECFATGFEFHTLPEVDLDRLARRNDPEGLMARRLQLLQRPPEDPDRRALLERARKPLGEVARKAFWQGLDQGEPDDEEIAAWLRRAARDLLDRLHAQAREERS